ncbi:hypothetical protein SUGI_0000760 [Cryptomeria japonica]|uniref:F-box/kelch-repeat protein At1g15670 n=1 Tax=Cryptomeria japonica TaxID=3369 RepID=UPI0024089420|nr:F-box/kelch-repeat protein At1g15670 [Cryptomeria japonica]GLJ04657.1 hypothetical protein SUGI_0000760 [Cryptomeria japonica]
MELLPEEIERECLLRVSYKSHHNLRAVCRSWEAVVKSSRFYQDRKKFGMGEERICLIQALPQQHEYKQRSAPAYGVTIYDPLKSSWERLPNIPTGFPLFSNCVCVNQKLVVLGGWNPHTWEDSKAVFVYDFCSCTWKSGTDMPTLQSFCACSVSPQGLIYVAGGHDQNKNALRRAAAYNVEKDKWEVLPDMQSERDECHGAFLQGKFYVISGYETQSQGRFERSAQVFDPETRLWSTLENMFKFGGSAHACVAAFGNLYFFEKDGVMEYDCEGNEWRKVCSLPLDIKNVTRASVWRESVFLCGSANGSGDTVFYMFRPPSNGEVGSQNWIPVQRPQNYMGFVQSSASLEI